ncbi:hypothetical protein PXK47_08395 [Phaeobacter gallaeciensis]|nr:hypothetical protein [Phaeobacter gallaeciensis]
MMPLRLTHISFLGLLSAAIAVAACTRVPEIEDRLSPDMRSASYPPLLPVDQLVTPLPVPEEQSSDLEQEMAARTARLQARAEELRKAQN